MAKSTGVTGVQPQSASDSRVLTAQPGAFWHSVRFAQSHSPAPSVKNEDRSFLSSSSVMSLPKASYHLPAEGSV
jgi:hypothetical protein